MPPQLAVYQFQLAPVPKLPPVAVSVVAPPQVGFTDAVAPVGAVDKVFVTFTVTLAQVVVLQVPSALT